MWHWSDGVAMILWFLVGNMDPQLRVIVLKYVFEVETSNKI